MFIQFKDADGGLVLVRLETIESIVTLRSGRHAVNFIDGKACELTKETAQELADKLTELSGTK